MALLVLRAGMDSATTRVGLEAALADQALQLHRMAAAPGRHRAKRSVRPWLSLVPTHPLDPDV
jgi:hypothetical protein